MDTKANTSTVMEAVENTAKQVEAIQREMAESSGIRRICLLISKILAHGSYTSDKYCVVKQDSNA